MVGAGSEDEQGFTEFVSVEDVRNEDVVSEGFVVVSKGVVSVSVSVSVSTPLPALRASGFTESIEVAKVRSSKCFVAFKTCWK